MLFGAREHNSRFHFIYKRSLRLPDDLNLSMQLPMLTFLQSFCSTDILSSCSSLSCAMVLRLQPLHRKTRGLFNYSLSSELSPTRTRHASHLQNNNKNNF